MQDVICPDLKRDVQKFGDMNILFCPKTSKCVEKYDFGWRKAFSRIKYDFLRIWQTIRFGGSGRSKL